MRIDGFSAQSYPIKRKPRKDSALIDDSVEDNDPVFEQAPGSATARTSPERISQLPVRQQDMIFQRAMNRNVANALTSYLTTAGFVDWDVEVLGLDLYI